MSAPLSHIRNSKGEAICYASNRHMAPTGDTSTPCPKCYYAARCADWTLSRPMCHLIWGFVDDEFMLRKARVTP